MLPKEYFHISIFHNLLFLSDGSCDKREDVQSSGNNRIFGKNSVTFKSVCFKNDRVIITQHTLNCVENCSEH